MHTQKVQTKVKNEKEEVGQDRIRDQEEDGEERKKVEKDDEDDEEVEVEVEDGDEEEEEVDLEKDIAEGAKVKVAVEAQLRLIQLVMSQKKNICRTVQDNFSMDIVGNQLKLLKLIQ